MGGGLAAFQFFWSLEKGTRISKVGFNESSPDILGPVNRYDHHGENKPIKTQINHAFVIYLVAKTTKFSTFADRRFRTFTVGFSDTLNLPGKFMDTFQLQIL